MANKLLQDPAGNTSSTRVAGYIILIYGMVIGAMAVATGQDAGAAAIPIYQGAMLAAGGLLAGGKLSEAAGSWGKK